jgi:hypothetical protein
MYNKEYATNDPATNSDPACNPTCPYNVLDSPYAHSAQFTLPVIALVRLRSVVVYCAIMIYYFVAGDHYHPQ